MRALEHKKMHETEREKECVPARLRVYICEYVHIRVIERCRVGRGCRRREARTGRHNTGSSVWESGSWRTLCLPVGAKVNCEEMAGVDSVVR